jgi:hypothetical protein
LLTGGLGSALGICLWTDAALGRELDQVEAQDVSASADLTARAFSYQGYLEEDGVPVTGPVDLIIRLHTNAACTSQIGPDIPRSTSAENGRFHLRVPLPEGIFEGQQLFLQMVIDGTAIGCQEILATPYALSLRPGAVIAGSLDTSEPYVGAVLSAFNDIGQVLHIEQLGGTVPAAYFFHSGTGQGIYSSSLGGDAIYARGGSGSGDYGGYMRGWGGVLTHAFTGPGVLAYDNSGIANSYAVDPGDVIASDDLIADNALGLGAPGVHGGIYVRDDTDTPMLSFTASNGLLELGGPGDDGDVYVLTNAGQRGLTVDGDAGRIWGKTFDNNGDLELYSHDDIRLRLDADGGSDGVFRVRNSSNTDVCTINEAGNFSCSGTKSAVVTTETAGQRLLYAVESPEVWFEDFGSGQLAEGVAVIELEPIFAETVNTEAAYHVFVTPVGGWAGLYVTDKTPTSFTVRADEGNRNLAFDYRIVAKRLGREDARLEPYSDDEVEEPVSEAADAGDSRHDDTLRSMEEDLGRRDPSVDLAPSAEEAGEEVLP